MANVKITELPSATSITPGTDVAPLVSGGATTKATPQEMVNAALAAGVSGSTAAGVPLVRIEQTGAGYALLVEDEANPDATPFVIQPSGGVSIGNTSDAGAGNLFVLNNIGATLITAVTNFLGTGWKALTSAGGTLKAANDGACIQWGAGGSANVTIDAGLTALDSVNLSPANKAVTISPTGTGSVTISSPTNGQMDGIIIGNTTPRSGTFTNLDATGVVSLVPANNNVTISPTGTGTVTINPATAGTMNNVTIGATTPAQGTFNKKLALTGAGGTGDEFSIVNAGASGDPKLSISVNDAADAILVVPSVIGSATAGTLIIDVGDATVSSWTFSGGDLFPSQGLANMTNGFSFIPGAAAGAAPTGTPTTTNSGVFPMYFEDNASTCKLWVYSRLQSKWVSTILA